MAKNLERGRNRPLLIKRFVKKKCMGQRGATCSTPKVKLVPGTIATGAPQRSMAAALLRKTMTTVNGKGGGVIRTQGGRTKSGGEEDGGVQRKRGGITLIKEAFTKERPGRRCWPCLQRDQKFQTGRGVSIHVQDT